MATIVTRAGKGSELTHAEVDANFNNLNNDKQETSDKGASGGYAGLTLFAINARNIANTFTRFLTNVATAARTWTFPDKDGTVAMLVILLASHRLYKLRRAADRVINALALLSASLLLIAQSAWWFASMAGLATSGQWWANYVWTIFNSVVMCALLVTVKGRSDDKHM